jgi:hypothetical protein
MPKNDKPIPTVRLASDSRNAPAKKPAAAGSTKVTKLAVRLDAGINDALRSLIRYRGDLAKMAVEALETVDLSTVALVNPETMARDTTISMPVSLHKKLQKLADQRGTSMNIAVNTALAHWLAAKGAIRLR